MILQVAAMEIVLQSKSVWCRWKRTTKSKGLEGNTYLLVKGIAPRQRGTQSTVISSNSTPTKVPIIFLDPSSAISDLTTPFSLPRPKLTRNVHSSLANICIQKESSKFLTEAFSWFSRRTHWLQPSFPPSHQGNPSNTNTTSQQTKTYPENCVEAFLLENKHFSHKQSWKEKA